MSEDDIRDSIQSAEVIDLRPAKRRRRKRGSDGPPTPPEDPDILLLSPATPLESARAFIARHHSDGEIRIVHHHRGDFYRWVGSYYAKTEEGAVRADLYRFLDGARRPNDNGELIPFQPTARKVSDVVDALKAEVHLPESLCPPVWLDGGGGERPLAECIICANGILHLPTFELFPPSAALFNTTALPVAFDDDVPDPKAWLAFLATLFGNDKKSIELLQDVFGYLLTDDTRQQKIILIVGPERSGKGTIGRVATALVGADAVCNPNLARLAETFGREPLIGRKLALVADARVGNRTDLAALAEQLLSISGEDNQTIDRKHRPAWTGKLSTRFLLLTNEIPGLRDASGALAGRFVVLRLTKSFAGKEDMELLDRLLLELPGILRWAAVGWLRLRARGRFVQPPAAAELVQTLKDLASPIRAFVGDRCDVGPRRTVDRELLWTSWQLYCETEHAAPGTRAKFGRDLRAAVPTVSDGERPRGKRGTHKGRSRHYKGIALKPAFAEEAQRVLDSRQAPLLTSGTSKRPL